VEFLLRANEFDRAEVTRRDLVNQERRDRKVRRPRPAPAPRPCGESNRAAVPQRPPARRGIMSACWGGQAYAESLWRSWGQRRNKLAYKQSLERARCESDIAARKAHFSVQVWPKGGADACPPVAPPARLCSAAAPPAGGAPLTPPPPPPLPCRT
jgi:hypothetical protein